jgi:hypothetical protein
MGLSSNIIWHQTDFNGLRSVLKSKRFLCSYSLESIKWKSSRLDLAFPMISFCDIPLSDISEYLGKYGNYTIGMKRSWGKTVGLCPVWYRDKDAISLKTQMDLFRNIGSKDPFSLTKEEIVLWQVIANTKNHEGELIKRRFSSYRFFDEREVRLVPSYAELLSSKVKPFMKIEEYDEYKSNYGNSLISNMWANFEYSDIAYIIYSNKRNSVVKLFKGIDCENIVFLSDKQVKEDIIGMSHNRIID